MDNMSVNKPIIPVNTNTPLDIRTLVNNYSDISLIPNPYIGMTITVKSDETNDNKMTDYKVKSLKSNELGMNNTVIDEVERFMDYLGLNGVIDIQKYGIQSINFNHTPPYSANEYQIAYNNFEGIREALHDMSEKGFTRVTFPKGFYPVCYRCITNEYGTILNFNNWLIRIPSGMIVDLNGSTIKVIFDSENKNPYDESTEAPAKMRGGVFKFDKTYNSVLRNGVMIGDRYDRAYSESTIELDKRNDQTYGVSITNGSRFNRVENMKFCGFMGDGISGDGYHDSDLGPNIAKTKFIPGYYDNQGIYKNDISDRYTSEQYMDCSTLNTQEIVVRTNIGYYRVPDFKNQYFEILMFDENENIINRQMCEHLFAIILNKDTKYIKITIFDEDPDQESINKTFQVTPTPPTDFAIDSVEVFDNNRGGFSNLPLDTTVQNCVLYNNGMANNTKWVLFPDSTRYAINCEDTLARHITVKNCYIHDCFNCLLISSKKLVVENNVFERIELSAVTSYVSKDVVITNNTFKKCRSAYTSITNVSKNVIIKSNIFDATAGVCFCSYANDNIMVSDNIVSNFTTFKTEYKKAIFSNNIFMSSDKYEFYMISVLNGVFKNCDIDIKYSQFITSQFHINIMEHSSNVMLRIPKHHCTIHNLYNTTAELYKIQYTFFPNESDVVECYNICNSDISNILNWIMIINNVGASEIKNSYNYIYNIKNTRFYNISTIVLSNYIGLTLQDYTFSLHIIFENCVVEFLNINNNAVFDLSSLNNITGENIQCVIDIKNCIFINRSNIDNINIVNSTNTNNVTVNIENSTLEGIVNNFI